MQVAPLNRHRQLTLQSSAFLINAGKGYAERGGKSDQILEFLAHHLFEPAVRMTLCISGLLLCAGVILTATNCFLFALNKAFGTRYSTFLDFWPRKRRQPVQLTRIKVQLGYTASIALQLLVVADVLDTLVKPFHDFSLQELTKLAIIAGIRAVLAYFLLKEVKEAEEELENKEEENVTI